MRTREQDQKIIDRISAEAALRAARAKGIEAKFWKRTAILFVCVDFFLLYLLTKAYMMVIQ